MGDEDDTTRDETSRATFQPTEAPDLDGMDLSHAVTIFPQRTEGERGIYRDEQLTLAKRLRAEGIDAGYAHDSEHRLWHGLKGGDLTIQIAIGLGTGAISSGVVAAICALLRRTNTGKHLHLRVGRITHADGRVDQVWFEAEGDADDVIEAFEKFDLKEQDGGQPAA